MLVSCWRWQMKIRWHFYSGLPCVWCYRIWRLEWWWVYRRGRTECRTSTLRARRPRKTAWCPPVSTHHWKLKRKYYILWRVLINRHEHWSVLLFLFLTTEAMLVVSVSFLSLSWISGKLIWFHHISSHFWCKIHELWTVIKENIVIFTIKL